MRSPDDEPERDERLELAHQREADGEYDGNGDEEGIRYHFAESSATQFEAAAVTNSARVALCLL